MSANYSTIDAYIAQFEPAKQELLQALRQLIQEAAPQASETISYQMPTFRFHGNLIHFAMNKNHIGIYPGPTAISHFASALAPYKTTKGALQLPLDKALPEKMLKEMVAFNLERMQDKKPTDWKRFHTQWAEAIEKTENILSAFPFDKSMKWGNDVYSYSGKNVVSFMGFKHHFAIWFYNGVFLTDPDQVLVSGSEGKTKSLRQWRFNDVKEMDSSKIKAYIAEAIQTVIDGKEIKPEKAKPLLLSAYLVAALESDPTLHTDFTRLTPGRQKEYHAYIEEAKQEKTKRTRLEKIKPLIAKGAGLHDKYKG